MSDRIYKGRLMVTGDIHEQNESAFPEAKEDFTKIMREYSYHSPLGLLNKALEGLQDGRSKLEFLGDDADTLITYTVPGEEFWISITTSISGCVDIEIGAAGV